MPSGLQISLEKSSTLISSFQPEQDLVALIERYRTGSFRPIAQIFESVDHETDVSFGIDLRQWAGEGGWNAIRSGEKENLKVPQVLTSLLDALNETYPKLPDDSGKSSPARSYLDSFSLERRKTWIYEVLGSFDPRRACC